MTTTSRDFDDCVLRIATDRDREAFATLFDHYAPRVKALLMRSGSPAAAAEELAQETLLSVWRKAHLFNPERASSAAWIFTIARNLRIDSLRRGDASVYAADLALAADEPEQPDAILSGAQDAELVRAAMRTLNPDQARAIEMAFFHEQTHTQISQALGVPLGTVKARIRFGMMKLRAFIERDGGGAA
ncbi:sigma-70 family RNA polymerase sigma factor [uncultured Caulobacter sp.]|uniref:sigma-70 family RNA polymerase sigma factor n=1 Tax=uncultured Caulobacter sp. TaxID=158749 RepID=UPI00261B441B|nr:sigma-70 family RNA polymerase sigma factor [uncultured Caulobacter sp.]